MTVGYLFGSAHPIGKLRNILIVGDKGEFGFTRRFDPDQKRPCLRHRQSVLRCLCQDPSEAQFRNGASRKFRNCLRRQIANPGDYALMKFMLAQSERDEYIHVEKILHGNSASISSTSLLVRTGAPGPRVRTGSPVRRSITIFAFRRRFLRGVKTTLSPSILASSGSPGRRPSFRRIGLGNTTCPLVEIRVCMVRQSYHRNTE